MQYTSPPVIPEPSESARATQTMGGSMRALLCLASLGAAVIHFAFAPDHMSQSTSHGLFFMAIAWFGVAWAVGLVLGKPSRAWFVAGVAVNLGIIAVWVVSRTVGISGQVEAVGFPDALATVLEGVVVLGSLAYIATRVPRLAVREVSGAAFIGASAVAVVALVTASMVPALGGGHNHGHEAAATTATGTSAHDAGSHDAGGQTQSVSATTAPAAHDHTASVVAPKPYDPTKPIDLSGTPGVTPQQQTQAENLIRVTLDRLPKLWSDPAVAIAAGFRSIGDGGTGIEHFVNEKFMNDNVMLDPDQPESLVWDTTGGGRKLVAAMYMANKGMTLDQVPDIGGPLTQWHVHTNLCYNAQGHVAGITNSNGDCPAGLVKPEAVPMIHVWLTSNKCGPFAALEGIGGGDIKPGEQRLCDTAHGGH